MKLKIQIKLLHNFYLEMVQIYNFLFKNKLKTILILMYRKKLERLIQGFLSFNRVVMLMCVPYPSH